MRFILKRAEVKYVPDPQLNTLIDRTITEVVPRILGDNHVNNGNGITPVVVHGDLWSGNASLVTVTGREPEEFIFDPSACYAHSEFEIGIMRMFGGFS